ncbi:MAG: hypothetical protein HY696_09480 [Deltaproteobacteria bacterium]|nr:hypothetical protein [Deltaproteobacteria bacterium]
MAPWISAAFALLDAPELAAFRDHPYLTRLRSAVREGRFTQLLLDVQQTAFAAPSLIVAPLRQHHTRGQLSRDQFVCTFECPRPIRPQLAATTRVGIFLFAIAWAYFHCGATERCTLPLDPTAPLDLQHYDCTLFATCATLGPTLAAVSALYTPASARSLPPDTIQPLGGDPALYAALAPRLAAALTLLTDEIGVHFANESQHRHLAALMRNCITPQFRLALTLHARKQHDLIHCRTWQLDRATQTLYLHATCHLDTAGFLDRLSAGDLLYFLWSCEAYASSGGRHIEAALTISDDQILLPTPTNQGNLTLFRALHPLTAPDCHAAVGAVTLRIRSPLPLGRGLGEGELGEEETNPTTETAAEPFTIQGPPQLVQMLRPWIIRGLGAFDDAVAAHFNAHGRSKTYGRLEQLLRYEQYQLDITVIPRPEKDGELLHVQPAVINPARRRIGLTLELPQRSNQSRERFWQHTSRRALLFFLAEAIATKRQTQHWEYDPRRHIFLADSPLLRALLGQASASSAAPATPRYAHVQYGGGDASAYQRLAPLLDRAIALMRTPGFDNFFPDYHRGNFAISSFAQLRDAVARSGVVQLSVETKRGGHTPTDRRTVCKCDRLDFDRTTPGITCTFFLDPNLSADDWKRFTPAHLLFSLWATYHRRRAWSGMEIRHGVVALSSNTREEGFDAAKVAFVRLSRVTATPAVDDDAAIPDTDPTAMTTAEPATTTTVVSPERVRLLEAVGFERSQLPYWPELALGADATPCVASFAPGERPRHIGTGWTSDLLEHAARLVNWLTLFDAHLKLGEFSPESRTVEVTKAAQKNPALAAAIAALGSATLPDAVLPRPFQHPVLLSLLGFRQRAFPPGSRLILHWLPGERPQSGMHPTADKALTTLTAGDRRSSPPTYHLYAYPPDPSAALTATAFQLTPQQLPQLLLERVIGGRQRAAPLLDRLAQDLFHLATAYRAAPATRPQSHIDGNAAAEHGANLRAALLGSHRTIAQGATNDAAPAMMSWIATPRLYHIERAGTRRSGDDWLVACATERGLFILLQGRRNVTTAEWARLLLAVHRTPAARLEWDTGGDMSVKDANGAVITTEVHDQYTRLGLEAAFVPRAANGTRPSQPPASSPQPPSALTATANPHFRACRDRALRDAYQAALRWFALHQAKVGRDYRPHPTDTREEAARKRSQFLHRWHDAEGRAGTERPPFDYNTALAHWQTVMAIYDTPLP